MTSSETLVLMEFRLHMTGLWKHACMLMDDSPAVHDSIAQLEMPAQTKVETNKHIYAIYAKETILNCNYVVYKTIKKCR